MNALLGLIVIGLRWPIWSVPIRINCRSRKSNTKTSQTQSHILTQQKLADWWWNSRGATAPKSSALWTMYTSRQQRAATKHSTPSA